MKHLRTFFNYLKNEHCINGGNFYKRFYICKEEIPVICLMPEQLKFLINNQAFHDSLTPPLRKSKAIFIFGCTVALRQGDLFRIKFTDIETRAGASSLQVKTQKTNTLVRIKLPGYAQAIIEQFKASARNRKAIFPPIPHSRFNDHIKAIAQQAGWTNTSIKLRSKRGKEQEMICEKNRSSYRFCDLVSSHSMRRTAITSMLMLGMNEYVVKLISGHSPNSSSFCRYVNLAQSYLDNEMDALCQQLAD